MRMLMSAETKGIIWTSRMISVLLSLVLGTLIAPCTGMSWTKISNRWCRSSSIFPTLQAAQGACLKLGSTACIGVYNERCDGAKSYLCRASPLPTSNRAGCLYQPRLPTFQPTTTTQFKSAVRSYLGHHPSGNCNEVIDYADGKKVQHNPDGKLKTDRTIAFPDVSIQYCGGWGYGRQFQQLRDKLETAFDGQISVREIEDKGTTGNFEVVVNSDLIWSKQTIEHHGFPNTKAQVDTILDAIRARQHVGLTPNERPIGNVKVSIQYCCDYGTVYYWVLEKLMDEFTEGEISVKPIYDSGNTGNFEVVVNGDLVWSKQTMENHGFPMTKVQLQKIIDAIKTKRQEGPPAPTTTIAQPLGPRSEVTIQYCGGWGYGKHYRMLKEELEAAFGSDISIKEIKDTETTGNFEVSVKGDLVWSKKTWGLGFPTTKEEDFQILCDDIRDLIRGDLKG